MKKSKRNALRFYCTQQTITYKTAYDEGEASLINISSGGCAFESATVPLTVHETILVSIKLEEQQALIEAKAIVVRAEENMFGAKFILIEAPTQALIRSYFAQQLRNR